MSSFCKAEFTSLTAGFPALSHPSKPPMSQEQGNVIYLGLGLSAISPQRRTLEKIHAFTCTKSAQASNRELFCSAYHSWLPSIADKSDCAAQRTSYIDAFWCLTVIALPNDPLDHIRTELTLKRKPYHFHHPFVQPDIMRLRNPGADRMFEVGAENSETTTVKFSMEKVNDGLMCTSNMVRTLFLSLDWVI